MRVTVENAHRYGLGEFRYGAERTRPQVFITLGPGSVAGPHPWVLLRGSHGSCGARARDPDLTFRLRRGTRLLMRSPSGTAIGRPSEVANDRPNSALFGSP